MAIMCSLAVCKAQQGMCGHEKVMLSVAVLAVNRLWSLLPDRLTAAKELWQELEASQRMFRGYVAGRDWATENDAGGHFQHPALAAVDHRQLARPFRFLLNA